MRDRGASRSCWRTSQSLSGPPAPPAPPPSVPPSEVAHGLAWDVLYEVGAYLATVAGSKWGYPIKVFGFGNGGTLIFIFLSDLCKRECVEEEECCSCGPPVSTPCQGSTLGLTSWTCSSHWSCLPYNAASALQQCQNGTMWQDHYGHCCGSAQQHYWGTFPLTAPVHLSPWRGGN